MLRWQWQQKHTGKYQWDSDTTIFFLTQWNKKQEFQDYTVYINYIIKV